MLNSHEIYGARGFAYPDLLGGSIGFQPLCYVCHCSVVHFSIQMTTEISNLKLRQTCIRNIDASLHEQRKKKLTNLCLNLESLAM